MERRTWRRWLAGVALGAVGLAPGCDREAEPVTNPEPISVESPFQYPVEQWDAGVEGEAVVMVHVTDMGLVDSVYVLDSSGVPALDSAAVEGGRKLKFSPGRRGTDRIAMWARLPVRFNRSGTPPASDSAASAAPAPGGAHE